MPENKTTEPRKKGKRPPKTFVFKGIDGQRYELTETEKLFCHYYLGGSDDRVSAIYNAGYLPTSRKSASNMALQILKKPAILAYVRSKLKEYGYDDAEVDLEHLFLIKQHHDLGVKERAIDKYRKMRGQYAAEKIKIEDEYDDLSDDELDEIIERKRRERVARKAREAKAKKDKQ